MANKNGAVAIVDDDERVLKSTAALLATYDFEVVTFKSAEEFLQQRAAHELICLILDIRMPGMSGMELQVRLQNDRASLPIIFITAHGDIPMAVKAIQDGAADFIEKPFSGDMLAAAIQRSIENPCLTDQNLEDAQNEACQAIAKLTKRETEVFDHLVLGKTTKMIARELDISPRTIDVHRNNIREKLGAQSIADLIRLKSAAG